MHHRAIATLQGILRPHVGLGKSRLETLCLLVVGMISARTVRPWKLIPCSDRRRWNDLALSLRIVSLGMV